MPKMLIMLGLFIVLIGLTLQFAPGLLKWFGASAWGTCG